MENSKENVLEYYQEATKDYEFWSKDYNMHFGLAIWNIFNREKMLQKMSDRVLNDIIINKPNANYLDLGCGCGATLRRGCLKEKYAAFSGITLSPWQINKCKELMVEQNITNGNVLLGDYHALPFNNNKFDGGYALESICHSNDRLQVLKEFSRTLKKGAKLVIADGFLKVNPEKQGRIFKYSYKTLCNGWALPDLPNIFDFVNKLGEAGFKIATIEDASWKIAPSVLHSPFIVSKYLLYALLGKAPLEKQNINNLKASFISLFMGLRRSKFSYYIITAVKA